MLIIDKQSRKLLDTLIAGTPNLARNIFSYAYIAEISGLDEEDAIRIVRDLERAKLVEYGKTTIFGESQDIGVALTQIGLKYRELRALDVRERWKERIFGFLSGIAVSVIAALLLGVLPA